MFVCVDAVWDWVYGYIRSPSRLDFWLCIWHVLFLHITWKCLWLNVCVCVLIKRHIKTFRGCHSRRQTAATLQTPLSSLTSSCCRVQRLPWLPAPQWDRNALCPWAIGASVLGRWGGSGDLWPIKGLPMGKRSEGLWSRTVPGCKFNWSSLRGIRLWVEWPYCFWAWWLVQAASWISEGSGQ